MSPHAPAGDRAQAVGGRASPAFLTTTAYGAGGAAARRRPRLPFAASLPTGPVRNRAER